MPRTVARISPGIKACIEKMDWLWYSNGAMHHDITPLVDIARTRMMCSRDPIHDVRHIERVMKHAEHLSRECHRSAAEEQALILAASWHDVARIITKKTSFIWMPFVDDMISAVMLWWQTLQHGPSNDITNSPCASSSAKAWGPAHSS